MLKFCHLGPEVCILQKYKVLGSVIYLLSLQSTLVLLTQNLFQMEFIWNPLENTAYYFFLCDLVVKQSSCFWRCDSFLKKTNFLEVVGKKLIHALIMSESIVVINWMEDKVCSIQQRTCQVNLCLSAELCGNLAAALFASQKTQNND